MRTEQIREIIKEEMEQRREMSQRKIPEAYRIDKEKHGKEFLDSVNRLCVDYAKRQKSENDQAEYLDIWSMRTETITGVYNYVLRLYDSSYYFDMKYAETEWKPSYMTECIEDDIKYFEKLIMSKVIRAKRYEVKAFLNDYLYETYIRPVPEVITDYVDNIKELSGYIMLDKDENIKISYGEMMEPVIMENVLYGE